MEELSCFIAENLKMEAQRGLCVKMHKLGLSTSLIGEILGVSASYVSKWTIRYKLEGVDSLYTQYKGKPSFLLPEQKQEILAFLSDKKECDLAVFQQEIESRFSVVFKSKESYYQLLKEGGMSWHKTEKSNPKKDETQILEKREEIKKNWIRKQKPSKKEN